MAQASGLQLLGEEERNPLKTSTFGTGQMIRHALEKGAKNILLGIGGSATNDAGIGMANALGYEFLDGQGNSLAPVGENLGRVAQIRGAFLQKDKVQVEVLCDVGNPLLGPDGAARVFARQKGADEAAIEHLELGMRHFAGFLATQTGLPVAQVPGAGAAGGLGAGALAFLGAKLKPGIEAVLDMTGFDRQLEGVGLILTGEGKLDGQTLHGKLIQGICQRARLRKIPVVALCGSLEATAEQLENLGLQAAFSIVKKPQTLQESIRGTASGLESLAYNVLKIIDLGKK
jgi:glycerate kinase